MSRVLARVLAVAAVMLPREHRARWREETLAVLLAVRGPRRLWFTVDTVLKAPVLARQYRRGGSRAEPGPWTCRLAGAGLLSTPVLVLAALTLTPVVGEDTAEFLLLMAPCGLLPAVAVRSFRAAAGRGGGPRHLLAALVTVFAGTGPVAAGALSVATGAPAVLLIGGLVPGAWLAAVSAAALARRRGPAALATIGVLTGIALAGLLAGVQLSMTAPGAVAGTLTVASLTVFAIGCPVWTTWSGIRLLRGRSEMLARAGDTPARR